MHVIGTAGHVDHGKSTLIEALTGVHPDRLKEEKQREMTIDLGFGWLSLENGQEVGIVDVPGHIDFIGNLLSGIGGIDAVLFVIAADEGIMPQTREHEAIIRLLQIPKGLIVITKTDLVDDDDILSILKEEIADLFNGSTLENAPIIEVSARTGTGLDLLKHEIEKLIASLPAKMDAGRPRLPVDRVFQLQGIGTVVTGTLQDGQFSIGDVVFAAGNEKKGRIRELQIHGKKVETAGPGNRVAINISGIAKSDVQRGDVIIFPKSYIPTQRMDISLRLLPELSKPLQHNSHAQLFIASKAVDARIRVLGAQQLLPGESGFVQLEFKTPIIAARNDKLILRHFSPGETIGGGVVLDVHPTGRHKRFRDNIIQQLSALLQDAPGDLISSYLLVRGISDIASLSTALNQTEQVILENIEALASDKQLMILNREAEDSRKWLIVHAAYWQRKQDELLQYLDSFHVKSPLLQGANLIQIRDHLKCDEVLIANVLQNTIQNGEVKEVAHHIFARSGHKVNLSGRQASTLERLSAFLYAQGHKPPSLKEIQAQFDSKTLAELLEAGLLIKVFDDLVYLPDQVEQYSLWIINYFEKFDKLQLAEFRDAFQTSRKYAQALLEYFDRIHLTERIGDYRILYRK